MPSAPKLHSWGFVHPEKPHRATVDSTQYLPRPLLLQKAPSSPPAKGLPKWPTGLPELRFLGTLWKKAEALGSTRNDSAGNRLFLAIFSHLRTTKLTMKWEGEKKKSPTKIIFTASEINKLKSKAKRIRFLQITLEIKTSWKSQSARDISRSPRRGRGRRAGRARAADCAWREAGHSPATRSTSQDASRFHR